MISLEEGTKPKNPGAGGLERAFAIIRLLAQDQPTGSRVTQLAKTLGLTQATVHRTLQSLIAQDVVEQDQRSKLYRLSIGFFSLAARAGSTTQYYFGDDPAHLGQHAWFIDNAGETTHPVGQKLPNRFGLHDIHGNVWEWTQDCTQDHGQRKGNDETVARFIRDCHRSYRGGSMANKAPSLRLTYSQSGGIGDRYFGLGLRIARDVP